MHKTFRLDCGHQGTRGGRLAIVREITETQMIGEIQVDDTTWVPTIWTLNGHIDDLVDGPDDLGHEPGEEL